MYSEWIIHFLQVKRIWYNPPNRSAEFRVHTCKKGKMYSLHDKRKWSNPLNAVEFHVQICDKDSPISHTSEGGLSTEYCILAAEEVTKIDCQFVFTQSVRFFIVFSVSIRRYQNMFSYHFPQIFYVRRPAHSFPVIFFGYCIYCILKFSCILCNGFVFYLPPKARGISELSNIPFVARDKLLLNHMMDYHLFVSGLWELHHVLSQSVVLTISFGVHFLSNKLCLHFWMSHRKLIAISEKTYKELAVMGTLEDSFDSVIKRMIDKEKCAASGRTLAGTVQTAATSPISHGGNTG
jgi:hypothetical protein